MENLKILKLLNNSTASKFGWINVNDLSNGQYSVNIYSTFKTMLRCSMLRSDLCNYSDADSKRKNNC